VNVTTSTKNSTNSTEGLVAILTLSRGTLCLRMRKAINLQKKIFGDGNLSRRHIRTAPIFDFFERVRKDSRSPSGSGV